MLDEKNYAALIRLAELKAFHEYQTRKIDRLERFMRFLAVSAFFLPFVVAFIWSAW